ncbi:hypothetical protein GCM10010104_15270 [Streptomyces indiaensis]|uniref:Uncharacterized protein n=1 Tax=Streptomyces indiaensis TaxID=284033 RepID=A0ABN3D9K8_9ACTN
MGDTVLPGGDERERCAGQTTRPTDFPPLATGVSQFVPNVRCRTAQDLAGPPRDYRVTPSIWRVCTDFAVKGTLADFPDRRMSECGV